MAYNVTSEWDDIHRRIGNYEPLPEKIPQSKYIKENIDMMEDLTKENKNISENDDLDEEFNFEEYKKLRMNEMKEFIEEPRIKHPRIMDITSQDYVREVNNAGKDICVILGFYQEYHQLSLSIVNIFEELIDKVVNVKFLKTISTKCVQDFPDSNLPYILYYRNGVLVKTFGPSKLYNISKTAEGLGRFFGSEEIKEFENYVKDKKTWKDAYNDKLGKEKKYKEEFSSDEDEREDRQFVSNKVYLKY